MKKLIHWIRKRIRLLLSWWSLLLSDNHEVSLKRTIAILSFILLVVVIVVALIKPLTSNNVNLLNNGIKYLSGIIGVGILGVAATDVFENFRKRDD